MILVESAGGVLNHQEMALELCDGFTPHDLIALGQLNQDALDAQSAARQALLDHVNAMWDKAKADGHAPADDPRFSAVAGLRDLAAELLSNSYNVNGH